tara:strand:- start:126 stop:491 length:366 start_codon:yes stop_codon:yes gene_type:complete
MASRVLNKRRFKGNEVGLLLLNSLLITQWLITILALGIFIYNNILHRGSLKWANELAQFMKPLQMILGASFLIWWLRSNKWESKNLPVNTKIRMLLFQYSIVSLYLAFDSVSKTWDSKLSD